MRATVGLAIVVGLAGGVVLAAAAAARRTDSVYPRFLTARNAGQGGFASDPSHFFGFATIDFSKVVGMPEIAESARFAFFVGFIRTPSNLELTPIADRNPVVLFASADDRFDRHLNRMTAFEGVLPDPSRADEVAIAYDTARAYRIHVGDVLQLQLPREQDFASTSAPPHPTGPRIALHVTGIEISPGELGGGIGYPPMHLTSAFYRQMSTLTPTFPALMFRLHHDSDLAPFLARVQTAIVNPQASSRIELLNSLDNAKSIERTTHVQAIALWLLALLTGATALLILAQTIARQTFIESFEYTTLRALGSTRLQLFGVSMLRVLAPAVAGAALATGIAFALSPLSPIGIARLADPRPGLSFDVAVLVGGAAILVAFVAALALYPSLRASGLVGTPARDKPAEPSRVAEALAGSTLPPSSVAGIRMALETGSGRSAVPVRSTIAGAVIGLVSIMAAFTFGSSLHRVVHSPHLQGVNWDAVVGDDFDPDDAGVVVPALRSEPGVTAFSAGGAATVAIAGRSVSAVGMDQIEGRIEPVILEGRAPIRPDELVMGVRTMRETHIQLGEIITVSAGTMSQRMVVVGRAVSPTIANEAFTGRGVFMTFEGLHGLVPQNAEDIYLFRVGDRSALTQVIGRLRSSLPGLAIGNGPQGGDVGELQRVNNLPLVLAGLLALLSVATIAHLVVTAVRTRRSQLAVLKTLGFVRRQVRAAVAWQATTIATLALAVAIPIGVAVGRWAWALLAGQMGFLSEPVVGLWQLFGLIPATILAANLVALPPARTAASTKPAAVLRTE